MQYNVCITLIILDIHFTSGKAQSSFLGHQGYRPDSSVHSFSHSFQETCKISRLRFEVYPQTVSSLLSC